MRKFLAALIVLAVAITINTAAIGAVKPVPGKTCSKAGLIVTYQKLVYRCVKSGKKLVWGKPKAAKPTAVVPSTSATASQTPVSLPEAQGLVLSQPKQYPKIVGALHGAPEVKNVEVPAGIKAPASDSNVKIWIYYPDNTNKALGNSGLFVKAGSSEFAFMPTNSDGTFYAHWVEGSYVIDVVEPNVDYLRKRYTAKVDSAGKFSINDVAENSRGYFTVTVDEIPKLNTALEELKSKLYSLAATPVSSFKSTSACQLVDQVTPNRGMQVDLSAGFPKVPQRLSSFGRIKALIVPIDFSDIQGKDNTVTYFSTIATNVRDFYYKQSYGAVAFDFDIVPNWVRAPFSSTKYGTGGAVGTGDPNGYLNALITLTDGAIDYSGYDAVYYLVPKEMPMANMGWGPAITSPHWISNGVIINGATGGADMYYNENNGVKGGTWKWMAHETGHAFGLYDEDLHHQSASLGNWSIMAMNWSNHAIELGAWDRYLQGWLSQSQVSCAEKSSLTTNGVTTKISPLVRQDRELKSIMVPLSTSKILVIESRKNESLDLISASHEGVLVYTVDMLKGQLGGGYEIQQRIGAINSNYEDAALRTGDSLTIDGVKITVVALDSTGDTVRISKP